MPAFSVLVPVGPADRELDRLSDLFDSLFHYEPAAPCVVLADDARRDRCLNMRFRVPPGCRLVSIPNPRKGWGEGYFGGLCAAMLTGLRWVHRNRPGDFVVKADSDALVIGPFAGPIAERFRRTPQLGMLGSHIHDPDGSIRRTDYDFFAPRIRTYLRPICRRGRRLQITLWGRARRVRRALVAAMANGYPLTEHCQGGAYAVSGGMIERMAAAGHLDDPLSWLRAGWTEDQMMGLLAYAVGLQMSDFNRAGEPFGVRYLGLPASPEELLARGYGIVHSVKDHGNYREDETRHYFRSVRRGAGAALGGR